MYPHVRQFEGSRLPLDRELRFEERRRVYASRSLRDRFAQWLRPPVAADARPTPAAERTDA